MAEMMKWKQLRQRMISARNLVVLLLMVLPTFLSAQRYKQQINFNASGDQTISLGRYRIGSTIRIEAYMYGPWAEDGGIYHIATDWGQLPTVNLRSETGIAERLKFYGYVDPASNSYAFLYATWDNQSPSESSNNDIRLTIYSEANFDTSNTGSFSSASALLEVLSIHSSSKGVVIGSAPAPSGYKLAVDGKAIMEEVKVETSGSWPDYVFSKEYRLPSLSETEQFIKENQHLPGIPSAEEVEAEGIALGEMNAKLLEKIEELTLYVIEQDRRFKEQESKIQELTLNMIEMSKELEAQGRELRAEREKVRVQENRNKEQGERKMRS